MDGAGAVPGGRASEQRVPRPEPRPRGRPDGVPAAQTPPSPAPPTRLLAVPVPESPALTASTGGTWGRGAERGPQAEGAPCCREPAPGPGEAAPPRPARADGDLKLHRAIERTGLPMYMKSLRWALAIMAVLLAVSTVAIVALASTAGARCRPCPQGWLWSGEHCYYLSADAQAWEASQAFCSAQHATLPLLIHTQDFLTRYPVTKYSWVGARRGPQGWHWIDGAPLPAQLLPEETEDQPHLECGGLEGGKLVALDCASSRPWACAKGTM